MIVIPPLRPHRLQSCTICARLPRVDEDIELSLHNPTDDGVEYCSVYEHEGDDQAEPYLHVELDVRESFGSEKPPKRSGSKKVFDGVINRFAGSEVTANVTGIFRVLVSAVSAGGFVQVEPQSVDIPGVQYRYRGASIILKGLPVRRVEWRECEDSEDDEEQIEIRIVGEFRFVLSDNYLVEAVDFLKYGLSIVVTGEFDDIKA